MGVGLVESRMQHHAALQLNGSRRETRKRKQKRGPRSQHRLCIERGRGDAGTSESWFFGESAEPCPGPGGQGPRVFEDRGPGPGLWPTFNILSNLRPWPFSSRPRPHEAKRKGKELKAMGPWGFDGTVSSGRSTECTLTLQACASKGPKL